MPTYSNAVPPNALYGSDIGFPWNNEAFPANGTAGQQFALPNPSGFPEQGRTVRWKTGYTGGPTAVDVRLQASMTDVDADYVDIDTSTIVGGEERTVTNVRANFLRAKLSTRTGGTNLTIKILA